MSSLGPQFLYHGTTREIKGQVLPAEVHGGHSYWDTTGSTRDEPARKFAWAHPDEGVTWDAAHDRVNAHIISDAEANGGEDPPLRRARVYAVKPNANQSPGHDPSLPGEVKSTHFDIVHQIDTMPGRQGTFPDVNWNEYTKGSRSRYLPGDEDANHPSNLSVQFGHRLGVHEDEAVTLAHNEALDEDTQRALNRSDDRNVQFTHAMFERTKDTPLPIDVKNRFGKRA